MQELANVETKWKNRLLTASRDELAIKAKIQRVHQLIALCERGVAQCATNVDALVDEQFNMVSTDPAQVTAWHHGPQAPLIAAKPVAGTAVAAAKAAAAKPGQDAKGSAKQGQSASAAPPAGGEASAFPPGYDASLDPALTAVVPQTFFANRIRQREALRAMLKALFDVPRLTRERAVQKPETAADMQHEVEEATRLATPIAELLAIQQQAALAKNQQLSLTKQASKVASPVKAKKDKKAAIVDAQSFLDDSASVADSEIVQALTGDLNPSDVLTLPTPRGIDSKLLHKVQLQRSRRLRLEASIELFKEELPKLERRLRGIRDMERVGTYSVTAVGPEMTRMIDEEASLQRVRQNEDEAFQARRGATPLASGSPVGRRGKPGTPSQE